MTTSDFRYGFRILGGTCEPRRLVDAAAAFAAYAACDPQAEVDREAYLSAFRFGADFADHLKATGSTAGFSGPCWSPWLWWDIDAEELQYAHKDAGALAAFLVERYAVEPGDTAAFLFRLERAFTSACLPRSGRRRRRPTSTGRRDASPNTSPNWPP